MTRATQFQLTRFAILGFVVCLAAAMITYAGGTRAEPLARGYSFLHSPLSTLGVTVVPSGKSNAVSSLLFTVGETLAGAGLLLFFGALLPLYAELPRRRLWLARVGCLAGVLSGIGSVAVGWLPVNLHPGLHGLSAQWTFRALLVASLPLGIAAAGNPAFSTRAVRGWFAFAFLLAGFIVLGIIAPPGTIRVIAQKLIVLSSVVIVMLESYEAERMLPNAQSGSVADRLTRA
jgi:hypothetical protein